MNNIELGIDNIYYHEQLDLMRVHSTQDMQAKKCLLCYWRLGAMSMIISWENNDAHHISNTLNIFKLKIVRDEVNIQINSYFRFLIYSLCVFVF